MDLLKPIVKYVTHGYFLRRDGYKVSRSLRELRRSQYFSPEKLAQIQLTKLRELMAFCYLHNSFYRDRFNQCHFHPGDLTSLKLMEKLPLLTKDDIREAGDHLFSEGYSHENTMHKRTGGSTGVPLHIYINMEAASFKKAAVLRHDSWAGLVPGGRLASVWGDTDKPWPWRMRLRNMLTDRAFYLDTLKFDEEHISRFINNLRRLHPPVLMGHAHSVFRLAEYIRDHRINGVSFRGIITTAMVLSEMERETIEEVFRSPVFNRYGCEEVSIIASECEAHQGMHLFAEGLYIELIDGNNYQPGKVIITDLLNRAMPLIRYEIGDYATTIEGNCPCGRGLPRLKEVVGRTADFLYTPEKKPVFGISILDTFVIHIPGFKQVQIVQDKYDHLDFYIVKGSDFSEESLSKLKGNVIDIFGERMQYDVHFVERIEQTERGKFRFSICKIKKNEE